MINKGDIKDILLVLLLAAIAVGISAGAEYLFYEYHLYNDNNIVEDSREEVSSSSFCTVRLNDHMLIEWTCKWDTPEYLKSMHNLNLTRIV